MPKLNFEQPQAGSRDIGGPPGSFLLLVAAALVAWWAGILLQSHFYQ